ncbi:MAG: eL32 family ribosomal protein [Candidatus Woesearchaeota archaeon]
MIEKLIEVRNELKSKKPNFIRHDAHKKNRLEKNWRRPKGRQNKMRLNRKGYARGISTGFGSPKLVKGMSRNGLIQNVVNTIKDFETLDNKVDGIIISRKMGVRKKLIVVDYAEKNNFKILNLDSTKFKESYNKMIENKKKLKESMNKRKLVKEENLKKPVKTKETKESTESKKTDKVEKITEENKSEKTEGDMQ